MGTLWQGRHALSWHPPGIGSVRGVFDWVAVLGYDGRMPAGGKDRPDFPRWNSEWFYGAGLQSYRQAGVRVLLWANLRDDPLADARAHVGLVRALALDGLVADGEDEIKFSGGNFGYSAAYCRTVRGELAYNGPLGLSTFALLHDHDIDWEPWRRADARVMPQAYMNVNLSWAPAEAFNAAAWPRYGPGRIGWRYMAAINGALVEGVVQDGDARSTLRFKEGRNTWGLNTSRGIFNRRTGKAVGHLRGFFASSYVHPTVADYDVGGTRPSPDAVVGALEEARREGFSWGWGLYLPEQSTGAHLAAYAAERDLSLRP